MITKNISTAFKALSNPIRREILIKLKSKNLTPGELSLHFPISKPSLSHHLTILRNANLIDSEKMGQKIYYSLNASVFYDIINKFLNNFE